MNLGFKQLEKSIYRMKDKYIEENGYNEDNDITLRHEKGFVRNPKHLISVFVGGEEYIADDFDEVNISSYHTGYALKMVPGMKILAIRDSHTGKWEVYSK